MITEQLAAIEATRLWVEKVIVAYQICPFARVPFEQETIRYACISGTNRQQLKTTFLQEMERLEKTTPEVLSTTLLIVTPGLENFLDYWDLVGEAEEWLAETEYTGIFQVASFHPKYIFAEAETEAAQNYTNRSPYPMLHIIREAQITAAVAHHPNIESVPRRNIALMEAKGKLFWQKLLQQILSQKV